MAEVVRRETTETTASPVAWFALVIAILGLVLAWAAYNRAGEDLEDQAAQGIEETADSIEDGAEEAGEAGQDAADAIERGLDTGPDGVDDGAQ